MIEYIIETSSPKEKVRIHTFVMKNKIHHEIKGSYFLILENGEKVKKIIERWIKKYSTKVYKLRKI